jgi:ABC-2 type transport system ATP-binding protein
VKAIDGIDLKVRKGEMFGIVGPDGAGKTTTIRILCGLTKPDDGTAEVFGKNILKEAGKLQKEIGYLSQKFSLYGDLSIDENIEFFAEANNVFDYDERRNQLLEFTRLKEFRNRPAEKLSGGMKQKLALACSLIHKPSILFLDEPTTGVDPVSRRDFWKILADLQRDGLTIIMTTPYLDEAERCARVALANKGRIIAVDEPELLKKKIDRQLLEIICSPARKAFRLLNQSGSMRVQLYGDRIHILTSDPDRDKVGVTEMLNKAGITVSETVVRKPSLENVFIFLVEDEN